MQYFGTEQNEAEGIGHKLLAEDLVARIQGELPQQHAGMVCPSIICHVSAVSSLSDTVRDSSLTELLLLADAFK